MSMFAPIRQWALAGCPLATRPEVVQCCICQEADLCLPGPGAPAYNPDDEQVKWEKMAVLACGHVIGLNCFVGWLRARQVDSDEPVNCPFCRFDLTCECLKPHQRPVRDNDAEYPVHCLYEFLGPKIIGPASTPDDIAGVPLTVSEGANVRSQVSRGCVSCFETYEESSQALSLVRASTSDLTPEEQTAAEAEFLTRLNQPFVEHVREGFLGQPARSVWCCLPCVRRG